MPNHLDFRPFVSHLFFLRIFSKPAVYVSVGVFARLLINGAAQSSKNRNNEIKAEPEAGCAASVYSHRSITL